MRAPWYGMEPREKSEFRTLSHRERVAEGRVRAARVRPCVFAPHPPLRGTFSRWERREQPGGRRGLLALVGAILLLTCRTPPCPATEDAGEQMDRLFGQFELPASWRARFWSSPDATSLLELCLGEVMDLVPVQAGLRFCRCPACGADEQDEPLAWSIQRTAKF